MTSVTINWYEPEVLTDVGLATGAPPVVHIDDNPVVLYRIVKLTLLPLHIVINVSGPTEGFGFTVNVNRIVSLWQPPAFPTEIKPVYVPDEVPAGVEILTGLAGNGLLLIAGNAFSGAEFQLME